MKATQITIGTKLKLISNGKELIFSVTEIKDNTFKLYNKFRISFYADIQFINQNLVK